MACVTWRWTPERRGEVESALRSSRTRAHAAKRLGITTHQLDAACEVYGFKPGALLNFKADPPELEVTPPPSADLPIEDLITDRKRRFEFKRRHEDAKRLIPVRVRDDLPIGILHLGDPHLDDDGTDLGLLEEHIALVKGTPGLYAANVGDTTNNWVGRLAKLYSVQTTTAPEGWRLAEWLVGELRGRWLYLVGGNHDAWSGSGDPLKWLTAQIGALYQESEVRVALRFPNAREVRVNCRHDFAGNSQWNPAHGPMKAAQMGVRDHILVAGHLHSSAYGVLRDPERGFSIHAIRVASYKRFDRYAMEKGLRDMHLSPCAVTVIDPRLPECHPDMIKIFWDPAEGAAYLTWLRQRRRSERTTGRQSPTRDAGFGRARKAAGTGA